MLRPETSLRPTPATEPLRPLSALRPLTRGDGGAGFGALYGEVGDEVRRFIDGAADADADADAAAGLPALPSLSAEGQGRALAFLRPDNAATTGAAADAGVDADAQQAFLAAIAPAAGQAAERLGVAPELVAAHAALESGWGQRPLRRADGSDTHNLFGIKAGAGWQGEVAAATTTEVEHGLPQRRVQAFRGYADVSGAFDDYTQLLLNNPRYRGALNTGGDARAFAQGLARGGYATDPAYADKLARVAARLQSRD